MNCVTESDLHKPLEEPPHVADFVEKPHMAALRRMPWDELLAVLNPPEVPVHIPNPRRQAAGKLNRQKRKGITAAGRQKLRVSAVENQPWRHSTGPRTEDGKKRSSENGRYRQVGEISVRQGKADIRARTAYGTDLRAILKMMGINDRDSTSTKQ